MVRFYIGIVDRGEEGWGATFPDLPGCTSGGETMERLFDMCLEATRMWAEAVLERNGELPRARSMEELLDDAEVKETISAIGPVSFIQIPLLRDDGRSVRANISIDAGLLDAIDAAAERLGVTRSSYLADAAREKMARGM